MDIKYYDQVLIMQDLTDKRYSDFTNMKSDLNKIDYEFTKMEYYINDIKITLSQMMGQKQISSPGKI